MKLSASFFLSFFPSFLSRKEASKEKRNFVVFATLMRERIYVERRTAKDENKLCELSLFIIQEMGSLSF
jgi:hypothetical protein